MASPLIVSVQPEELYETGPIIIYGENFVSLETNLYIGGIKAEIKNIKDDRIEAWIPLLKSTKVYDIKVSTSSSYSYVKAEWSCPYYASIRVLDPTTRGARTKGSQIPVSDGSEAIPALVLLADEFDIFYIDNEGYYFIY